MTINEALRQIRMFEQGNYRATLEDGMAWEALGLGRVVFKAGRAVWVR